MHITVPPVPKSLHPAACWRKQLTGLNPQAHGGYRALGTLLHAGDTVDLPDGTLILTVDKATRGWEDNYRTLGQHAVKDATVTVYLAADDTLTELWSRQYVSSRSAFGATTMKKLTALLEKHPVPAGDLVVVREVRRPNSREGRCRWCRGAISAGRGHIVGHGQDAQVEHYEDCPTAAAKTGEACALCGVSVVSYQAARHHKRDGVGDTEVRHKPVDGRTCLQQPVASAEVQAAALAERDRAARERAAREREEQKKKEKAKAARAAARAAQKKAEHDAEQARVAGLKTVTRSSRSLYDKNLGNGTRACLQEHTDTLEDGTTTLRWTVETYSDDNGFGGEDYAPDEGSVEPYTDLALARADYQSLRYEKPEWKPSHRSGPACDECGRGGASVERYDSSGIAGRVCDRCDRAFPEDYLLSFA